MDNLRSNIPGSAKQWLRNCYYRLCYWRLITSHSQNYRIYSYRIMKSLHINIFPASEVYFQRQLNAYWETYPVDSTPDVMPTRPHMNQICNKRVRKGRVEPKYYMAIIIIVVIVTVMKTLSLSKQLPLSLSSSSSSWSLSSSSSSSSSSS